MKKGPRRSRLIGALAAASALVLLLASGAVAAREALRFEADDTLAEIQEKISNYGYQFTVGHTWVFDLPPEDKARLLGRRRPAGPAAKAEPPDMGPLAAHLGRALPGRFDWRDVDGRSYIGPIKDQGLCGSCYAFGASAAAECAYNYAMGLYDESRAEFSESWIIWCLGRLSPYYPHFYGCDGSDYDYMELEALTRVGAVPGSNFPYQEDDPGDCPYSGAAIPFRTWGRIGCNDIEAIKTAILVYGAVDASVWVGSAFEAYTGGIYEDSKKTCDDTDPCYFTSTNHIIALVGWDDNGDPDHAGYWILRNSWGEGWGEQGYMRLKYTSANVACEGTYLYFAPTMVSRTPAPDAAGVDPGAPITMIFNQAMDAASLSRALSLTTESVNPARRTVKGTVRLSGDGLTATFVPERGLDTGRDHRVVISTTATDRDGAALPREYAWNFSTRPQTDDARSQSTESLGWFGGCFIQAAAGP
ncbi:MAG: Ig-like domain-containing protein [Proteobacteria bacterium]|nr:Ig-like domain-containing protein [Pseudomonadota bacterium]